MTLLKGENKNKFCGLKLIPEHRESRTAFARVPQLPFTTMWPLLVPWHAQTAPRSTFPAAWLTCYNRWTPLIGHDHPKLAAYTAVPTRCVLALDFSQRKVVWPHHGSIMQHVFTALANPSSTIHPLCPSENSETPVKIVFMVLFSSVFIDKKYERGSWRYLRFTNASPQVLGKWPGPYPSHFASDFHLLLCWCLGSESYAFKVNFHP